MSEELIEERRVYIESFLRKVQIHPELEGAPSLAAFFSPDAEVFEAAKKAHPGNAPASDTDSNHGSESGSGEESSTTSRFTK